MAEKEAETENSASSCIILKLPLSHIKYLKNEFESDEDGLRIEEFLSAMVEHAKFNDVGEILRLIPSMIDFFRDVDINGDGQMDWQEFTQSIITGIEKETLVFNERFVSVADMPIQKLPAHMNATATLVIPEMKRMFVGIHDEVLLYGLHEQSNTLLTPILKRVKLHHLSTKERFNVVRDEPSAATDMGLQTRMEESSDLPPPSILGLSFIHSLSLLCCLRNDNYVEFFRLVVRSSSNSMSGETIEQVGLVQLGNAFTMFATKDLPKQPVQLFAVGADRHIYFWTVSLNRHGRVLLESPSFLHKHTDYVLDLVVIVNDSFKLLVSVGMDKRLRIWDLETLHCKASRTYTSGLQCVGFDGKSIVLAGGTDNSIVAWDLDSQIDAALFRLMGHTEPVTRIIGMSHLQRCMSLDLGGKIHLWDIAKGRQCADEERLIDVLSTGAAERISTFDCFQKIASRYKGLIIVSQGKQQHVHVLRDVTPSESPPITAMFTSQLLMIISIHTKNIVQWNVLTGAQIKSFKYAANVPNCELTCAVLADRNRKFITGDSFGNIILYSCLTIQKLRQFAQFPSAIKHIVFSQDKNIVVIANPGHLHVLDTSMNNVPDNGLEYRLRDVVAHTVDVVCVAFSRVLDLIATGDSDGVIKIWSYSSLIIESVIDTNDVMTNGDFCQITFMEPYPLLLVPDIEGNYFVFAVGYAALKFGKKLWKIETKCTIPRTMSPLTGRSSPGGSPYNSRKSLVEKQNEKAQTMLMLEYQKKAAYLRGRRLVSSILLQYEMNDPSVRSLTATPNIDPLQAAAPQEDENDDENDKRPMNSRGVPASLTPFVEDRKIMLYCGQDDGHVALCDLTAAMADINVRALEPKEYVYNRPQYNCKRKLQRGVSEEMLLRSKWGIADIQRVRQTARNKAILSHLWTAHENNIVSMAFVGDKNVLLTASDDHCIQTWTPTGESVAVLTKGRELDSIMRPTWLSPIDIEARQERRKKEALDFSSKLNLQPMSRHVYIAQQMAKFPHLFSSKDEEDGPPMPVVRSSSAETLSLKDDASRDRFSLLKQLAPDSPSQIINSSSIDLDSIPTDRSEVLPHAKIDPEKRYVESVTLDASKMIENMSMVMTATAVLEDDANSQSSDPALLEHAQRKALNRKRREAEALGATRQKALYPHLSTERKHKDAAGRSGMLNKLLSTLNDPRRIGSADGGDRFRPRSTADSLSQTGGLFDESISTEAPKIANVPTLNLSTTGGATNVEGIATSSSLNMLPSLTSANESVTPSPIKSRGHPPLFGKSAGERAKTSQRSTRSSDDDGRSVAMLTRYKEKHTCIGGKLPDQVIKSEQMVLRFDRKISQIEKKDVHCRPNSGYEFSRIAGITKTPPASAGNTSRGRQRGGLVPVIQGGAENDSVDGKFVSYDKWSKKLQLCMEMEEKWSEKNKHVGTMDELLHHQPRVDVDVNDRLIGANVLLGQRKAIAKTVIPFAKANDT